MAPDIRTVAINILYILANLTCGFLFGELIWCATVRPYGRYFDLELNTGFCLPELVFCLVIGLAFATSLKVRSTIVLFVPNMMGSATQNYIIVLMFTALASYPLANIALNSVESVRVIGCSLTLTFDQLREHVKLVLNPIAEILSDQDQKDLDPLRRDLLRIQHMVAEIQRNARLKPSDRQAIDKLIDFDDESMVKKSTSQASVTSSTSPIDPKYNKGVQSKSGVDIEWDLENFGVKANVDMNKLRALAREGKLKLYFGRGDQATDANVSNLNLTDILYASCINIFVEAKQECIDSVEEMEADCKSNIGPYFATFWCAPFTYSLESFCPWIMNQLVDERSLCKQVKIVDVTSISSSSGGGNVRGSNGIGGVNNTLTSQAQVVPLNGAGDRTINTNMNVNKAFRELNKQIESLNENILIGGNGGSQAANDRRRVNRLEISLTFNEQTRKLFTQTKQLIEFIGNKYKMRKLFADALLFVYDIYTTYTFLLIMGLAWRYRHDYLTRIKFDNCYITRDFIELDNKQRMTSRRSLDDDNDNVDDNSTPIDNNHNKSLSSSVLPLTRDESERYINTFTCKRRTSKERHVQQVSCSIILIFLAFTLSLLYLDDIFHDLLVSIQDRSLIRYKELGYHELDVQVRGDGVIARLVKRLVSNLNSIYNLDRYTSTRDCLPVARETPNKFYLEYVIYIVIYFAIDQVSIYAMRLRHVTCAYFYPAKELQRVQYLHRFIRYQRYKLARSGLKDYLGEDDEYEDNGLQLKNNSASKEQQQQQANNELRVDQQGDYSLRDALMYLRRCVGQSARCCRCFDHIFSSPTPSMSSRRRQRQ